MSKKQKQLTNLETGLAIKFQRLRKLETQTDVAYAMGISRVAYNLIEHGVRSLKFWEAIRASEYLGFSIGWLKQIPPYPLPQWVKGDERNSKVRKQINSYVVESNLAMKNAFKGEK